MKPKPKTYDIEISDDDRRIDYVLSVEPDYDAGQYYGALRVTLDSARVWFGEIGLEVECVLENPRENRAIGDELYEQFGDEIDEKMRAAIADSVECERLERAEMAEQRARWRDSR